MMGESMTSLGILVQGLTALMLKIFLLKFYFFLNPPWASSREVSQVFVRDFLAFLLDLKSGNFPQKAPEEPEDALGAD